MNLILFTVYNLVVGNFTICHALERRFPDGNYDVSFILIIDPEVIAQQFLQLTRLMADQHMGGSTKTVKQSCAVHIMLAWVVPENAEACLLLEM